MFLNKENKIKNSWWAVVFFLILFLFLFPLIILAKRFSFEIIIGHQLVLLLMVSIICQGLRRKPFDDITGSINYTWLKDLFIGFFFGALLMVIPAVLLTLLGFVHWQINIFSYANILSGCWMFFLVASAEELLFRGFLFQRLIQAFGKWPAQLIVGILFLLSHINNPGMTGLVKIIASINIFIASVLFGLAYLKTKSLALPLGLHFMANAMQGTILGFGVSGGKDPSILNPVFITAPKWITGGDFGLEASIFGLCCVIVFAIFFYRWTPKKGSVKCD
jgi:uncharacterized protein